MKFEDIMDCVGELIVPLNMGRDREEDGRHISW